VGPSLRQLCCPNLITGLLVHTTT